MGKAQNIRRCCGKTAGTFACIYLRGVGGVILGSFVACAPVCSDGPSRDWLIDQPVASATAVLPK